MREPFGLPCMPGGSHDPATEVACSDVEWVWHGSRDALFPAVAIGGGLLLATTMCVPSWVRWPVMPRPYEPAATSRISKG